MDKYKVVENSINRPGNELALFQTVRIQGKIGKTKTVCALAYIVWKMQHRESEVVVNE